MTGNISTDHKMIFGGQMIISSDLEYLINKKKIKRTRPHGLYKISISERGLPFIEESRNIS